ncbi:hypothetical protein ACTFIZ_010979 [Dictyostelium cf. discoideum]
MEGFIELENDKEFDVFLILYQNDKAQYFDCDQSRASVKDLTNTENNNINNINNNYQQLTHEILNILNNYISNTDYHFDKSVRSRRWFYRRFNEINWVYFTLNNQLNNNILNLQNFNPVLAEIKRLRRLLIIKHYDSLLLMESASLPTDAKFTFSEIPFTFSDDEINNWKNKNVIGIGKELHWYQRMEGLMEMVEVIAYKIIHSEESNFQI